jgi:hypothetical protein
MNIRPATSADAQGMSNVLDEIFDAGLRKSCCDANWVLAHYIEHEHRIECTVAESDLARILGSSPYVMPLRTIHMEYQRGGGSSEPMSALKLPAKASVRHYFKQHYRPQRLLVYKTSTQRSVKATRLASPTMRRWAFEPIARSADQSVKSIALQKRTISHNSCTPCENRNVSTA